MVLKAGVVFTPHWRPGNTYLVTDEDVINVAMLRGALITPAKRGEKLTYTEVTAITGVWRQGPAMTKLLDLLSEDCHQQGEPSLAAICTRKDTGTPGDGFVTSTYVEDDMQAVYDYWQQRTRP